MSANPVTQAVRTEPVRTAGLIAGVAIFLAVRYGHVDADLATQLAALIVPTVLAELARMHVIPAVKVGDAQTALASIAQLQTQVADLQALGLGGDAGKAADALAAALADTAAVLQDGFDRSLAAHRDALAPHTAALEAAVEALNGVTGHVAGLQTSMRLGQLTMTSSGAASRAPSVASPAVTVSLPTAGPAPSDPVVASRDAGAVVPAPVASAPASPGRTAPPMWKG